MLMEIVYKNISMSTHTTYQQQQKKTQREIKDRGTNMASCRFCSARGGKFGKS